MTLSKILAKADSDRTETGHTKSEYIRRVHDAIRKAPMAECMLTEDQHKVLAEIRS